MTHASPQPAAFQHRGVLEGFYGPPWSHADRLWWIERLGRWGLNRYVCAPKDDAFQRENWRDPYPDDTMRAFAELVERGDEQGVQVGFAISPGLSIRYSSPEDLTLLQRKLARFREIGSRFLTLALDDTASELSDARDRAEFGSLAEAHVRAAEVARDAIGAEATLWLVPVDYAGVADTDYLATLGQQLPAGVEVGWSGRTVVSPTLTRAEAEARARCLRRRLLVWDNTPVADGPMRVLLHQGPYVGRDPELATHVSGILLNAMQHAHASATLVHTAAAYLADPAGYEPEAAWLAATREIGAGAPDAFATFAAAHRFSALADRDGDRELAAAFEALRRAVDAGRASEAPRAGLRALLDQRLAAAETLRDELADRALLAEIEPWIEAHHTESARMSAALDALETVLGEASALDKCLALVRFEGRLTRLPPASLASYGPRRVLVPQFGDLTGSGARFGSDPCLFRDACLADRVLEFVEDTCRSRLGGRAGPGGPVRSAPPA